MDHSDEEAPMETEEEVEEQRWVAFTEELFAEFSGDISDDDRWRLFCDHSAIQCAEDNMRSMILQEFLFQTINFCRERGVSFVQAAAAVKSCQITFDHCVFRGSRVSVQDTRSRFEKEFSSRIRAQPAGTFNVKFVEAFSSYIATTVLRNLTAYQFAFRNDQDTVEKEVLLQVQTPFAPPPLCTATESEA